MAMAIWPTRVRRAAEFGMRQLFARDAHHREIGFRILANQMGGESRPSVRMARKDFPRATTWLLVRR